MIRRARLRLTVWYAGMFVTMLAVLGAAAFFTVRRSLAGEIDRGVRTVVDGVLATALDLDARVPPEVDREYEGETADVFLLILRADGRLVANPSRIETEHFLPRDLVRRALSGQADWTIVEAEHERFRLYVAPVMRGGSVAGAVIGGRSLSAHERDLNTLLAVLGATGVAGAAMAVGGGYLLAGRALRPIDAAYERQRRFVGDASHELRSPLAVIRASSELLLREPLTEAQHESVQEIRDTSAEAAALIDDLLTLARLDHERPVAAVDRADLAAAAAGVLRQMQPLLAEHGSRVSAHLVPAPGRCSDLDMRRVLRALIENVIAHTPAGTALDVATGVEGASAILHVRDHGPGVPAAALDTLFERFTRVDRARTPGSGSGLGLAIVAVLVRRRGGHVTARNHPAGGLDVEVRLPVA